MATERIQRRIARLLDQIEEAMEILDWESVRGTAQAVLALDGENLEALAFLGAAEKAAGVSSAPPINQLTTSTQSTTPTAAPAQPTSFANGRYQVRRFLGGGSNFRRLWPAARSRGPCRFATIVFFGCSAHSSDGQGWQGVNSGD